MIVKRKLVSERLRLTVRNSYRIVPGGSVIDSTDVIRLLNDSRTAGQPKLEGEWIPELLTAEELTKAINNELMDATAKDVRNWTKRLYPVPHYRISSKILLFKRSTVEQWLRGEIRSRTTA